MSPPPLPCSLRLERRYDLDRLRAELASLEALRWELQTANSTDGARRESHNGRWRAVSLWGPDGSWEHTGAGPRPERYRPTPLLDRLPYMRRLLDGLGGVKHSVRLLALEPGGRVAEHRDAQVGFAWGLLRLHVPITTNPEVELWLDGQRLAWEPGWLWYADWSRPHSLHNGGDTTRVHLVIDVAIDDRLLALFPADVVARAEEEGLVRARAPVAVAAADLERCRCRFLAPAGFFSSVPRRAALTPCDGHLLLELDDGVRLAWEPWSRTELGLVGGPPAISLEVVPADGGVREVRLHCRRGRETTTLTVPEVTSAAAGGAPIHEIREAG